MLSSTLLVDTLNGMFSGFHIGEIFRVLLLTICFYILCKKNKRSFQRVIIIVVFLGLNLCLSVVLNGIVALGTDISVAMKSIIFIVVYKALITVYKNETEGINKIDKIIRNNLIYGPALFIFSTFLGKERASYSFAGISIGNKGAFLSLNSVNAALIVLLIYAISMIFLSEKKLVWALAAVYVSIPMVMLGTKTSLAMIIIIPVYFVFLNSKKKKTWGIVLVGFISGLLILPIFSDRISEAIDSIMFRQNYLFSQRDFATYLFSTRNLRLDRILNYYQKTFSLFDVFPGRGYYGIHMVVAQLEQLGNKPIPIEMDWVDILVTYGFCGFLYTYIPAIKALKKTRKYRKAIQIQRYFWTAIILLMYGSLAGHLFLEAISSSFFAIVVAGMICEVNRIEGVT